MTKQTKEQVRARKYAWYLLNQDRLRIKARAAQRKYYSRPEIQARRRIYAQLPYVKEREATRRQTPSYHQILLARNKEWRTSKRGREYRCAYAKARYKACEQFRIRTLLSNRLKEALRLYGRGKHFYSIKYGIDFYAIISHLGAMPNDGRTYHIDHIIPIAAFDLTNPVELKKAFAPENHRWLPDVENLSKNARWVDLDGNLRLGKRILQDNFTFTSPNQSGKLAGI